MIEINKLEDTRHKYGDIINLDYYVSKKHPQMSIMNRAAQFAPFAALTGYSDEISEASRIVDNKLELDDDSINDLNNKLLLINNNIKDKPKVSIIYFVPDKKKKGGKYIKITNNIRKIDLINDKIIFINKNKINISNIIKINILDK